MQAQIHLRGRESIFFRALIGSITVISGCGARAAESAPAVAPTVQTEAAVATSGAARAPEFAKTVADVPAAQASQATQPTQAPGAPAAVAAGDGARAAARPEMLDIEGTLNVEVSNVVAAAALLRKATRRFEGVIVEDVVNEQGSSSSARFTVRIAAPKVDDFLDAVGETGRVTTRVVNARDVGKEYFDTDLRLQNLTNTMRRYEEILKQAKDVNETLRVEAELSRLRGEIEQAKGNLRYMQDRVARATLHVNFTVAPSVVIGNEPEREPEAKFYPGLRLVQLSDLRGERGHTGYLGAGLSAMLARSFSLRIDGLREAGTGFPTEGLDVVLITVGGDMYSEFLGGGRREFLNPYLGVNAGYARIRERNEGLAGVTLGVELLRTKAVLVDAEVRGFGLFFSEKAHVGVEPALGISFPF